MVTGNIVHQSAKKGVTHKYLIGVTLCSSINGKETLYVSYTTTDNFLVIDFYDGTQITQIMKHKYFHKDSRDQHNIVCINNILYATGFKKLERQLNNLCDGDLFLVSHIFLKFF